MVIYSFLSRKMNTICIWIKQVITWSFHLNWIYKGSPFFRCYFWYFYLDILIGRHCVEELIWLLCAIFSIHYLSSWLECLTELEDSKSIKSTTDKIVQVSLQIWSTSWELYWLNIYWVVFIVVRYMWCYPYPSGYITGTGAIIWLPLCQWCIPEGYIWMCHINCHELMISSLQWKQR